MNLTEAKEQIAKKYNFNSWADYTSFWFNTKVSPINKQNAWNEVYELVLSSKDKEIAELKVHNEQMVNDCNLYRRKSNDYYCQNDKLKSELSQLKEENTELKNLFSKDTPIKTTKELLQQIQSLQEEMNTMKIKYKQSLIVLRDICKSARLEGGMNTANELLSEL